MATIPSVQLFRNSKIKTGRQAAIDALEAQKAFVADGGLILARYSIDGEDNNVKTLLGIVRNSGSGNADLTIIDVEGAAENVQKAIEKAINDLNQVDAEIEGQYVSSVSEANGIITVTRKPLPSFNEKFRSGKAITAITQTNGLVDVKFGGVAAANVSVADSTGKFDSGNVEGALLEIKTSLDNAIGTGGTVEKQISDAINGINGTTEITDGKVITAISQTKGIVSVSTATLGADKVSASTIESSDSTVAVTGTKVSEQIASLATSIKSVSGDAKSYSISSMTKEETTALGANVLEAYKLVDEDGAQAGATIKIYKDSSLKSVALNGQMLNFTYILADGSESTVGVDVSTFLAESEFKDGLEVVDGIVKVKKDASSEKFLSVSESGVKLDGVQAAINTAAAAATTKVEKASDATHITVTSRPSDDGVSTTYTIGESDIASATDLTTETNNRTKADKELADKLGTGVSTAATETVTAQLQALSGTSESNSGDTSVKGAKKYTDGKIEALDFGPVGGIGQVITTISQTNGQVSASAIDLTASNVKATESTGVPTAVDVTGETVSEQIASLATSIKSASTAAAAAHTKVTAKPSGHVTVEVSNDGSHDVVTITEDDIASARALETETNARQTQDDKIEESIGLDAEGNHKTTTGNYTNGATTVVGEIAALDTKLKEVSDTLGTGVSTAERKTVTEQLQALSGTSESLSGDTSVEGAKKYTDGKIEELSLTPVGGNGQVITTISQTDGKVSVTAATLGAENVSASTIDDDGTKVAVTGDNVKAQIESLAKSIKNVYVTEQLANYYTKTEIDTELLKYPTNDDAKRLANAEALDEINKLNATVVSTSGTSTTEAIKIIQTSGKIASITLGAFDCGTY